MTDTVRLVRTDLPPKQRKPIREAIQILYKRTFKNGDSKDKRGGSSRNAQRAELAKALKHSLDQSFGPHWHVLVGEKSGFACKKRNETMAIWRVDENQVVMWQSPGIEEPEAEEASPNESRSESSEGNVDAAAEGEGVESKEAVDAGVQKKDDMAESAGIIKVLEPAKLEEDSEEARVVDLLRKELATPESDRQLLSARVRRRLTEEFGTIWHVMAGSDFAVEAAVDRRNHVLVTSGKTRLLCFQHEQFKGGTKVEWGKITKALPYLLLTILCLAFMTMQAMCGDEEPVAGSQSKFQIFLREKLCQGDWESRMQYLGVGALGCLAMTRFAKRMTKVGEGAAMNKQKTA